MRCIEVQEQWKQDLEVSINAASLYLVFFLVKFELFWPKEMKKKI
jgi:hypothetical protein